MTVALNTEAYSSFEGTDLVKEFPITFNTFETSNIVATVYEVATEETTTLVYGSDFDLENIGYPTMNAKFILKDAADVPPGWMGPIPASQAWLQNGNLKVGFDLFVKFNVQSMQPVKQPRSPLEVEKTVDRLTMNIKALKYEIQKALKFSDYTFKEEGDPATAEELVTRMQELEDQVSAFVNSGGALPQEDLVDGAFLEGDTASPVGAVWKPGAMSGFSARFNEDFTSTGLEDTLRKIIKFQYTPPAVSLSASGNGTVREKGNAVTAVTLTANVTKRSDLIARIRFFLDGIAIVGADFNPPLDTDSSATPFNWAGSFSDNVTFSVQVNDDGSTGGPSTVNATAGFTFVYPYYSGAAAPGRTAAQVAALTKDIRTSNGNLAKSFTTVNGDVYYFAYPASYGALTSIKDVNNFESIGGWTRRTENITGLNGVAVSYYIYEFNNPVIAGTTSYTFIR